MIQAVRHFLLALQFFTRIPVTGRLAQWVGYSPEMLRASTAHFPGVGWLVGSLSAAVLAGFVECVFPCVWCNLSHICTNENRRVVERAPSLFLPSYSASVSEVARS